MEIARHIRRALWTTVLACGLLETSTATTVAGESDIPTLNAEVGECALYFTVKDPQNKPLYNAKIRTILRYGFLNMRKLSLEVSTNSDGKAKITGLPASPKKEFEFEISGGSFYKQVRSFPSSKCAEDKIDIHFSSQDLRKTD